MNSLHFLTAFAVFTLIVFYCTKKESNVKTTVETTAQLSQPTPASLINVFPNPFSRFNTHTQPLPTQNILDIPKSFDTPQDIAYKTQWGTSNTKNA